MSSQAPGSNMPTSIPVDDTIRGITSGLAQLDAARAAAYENLLIVRAVKDKQLSVEQQLIEMKYGPDDPQIAAIKARLAINQAIRTDLTVAQVQAATPQPIVDGNSYVFHGFVRDRQRQARPQLTVALYDPSGFWVREAGYSNTDPNGYFLLRYTQVAPVKGKKAEIDQSSARFDGKSLEVRVYDSQQKLLYRDPTPLSPKLGQVDYRVIIFEESAGAPPPVSADSAPPITAPNE